MIPPELSAARLMAAKMRPYLSPALFALTPIESKGLKTLACDTKWRLYYCPSVFKTWTIKELASVILHEVSHLLREHHSRCKEANAGHSLWNKAADIEINDSLVQEGIIIPPELLRSFQFNLPPGKLAEEYYLLMLKKQQDEQQKEREQQQQQQEQNEQPFEQFDKEKSNDDQQENNFDDLSSDSSLNNLSDSLFENNLSKDKQNQEDDSDNNSLTGQDENSSSSKSQENQTNSSKNSIENSTNGSSDNSSSNIDNSQPSFQQQDSNSSESQATANNDSGDSVDNADEELSEQETPLQPGCGSCGSCADGMAKDYEEKGEDSGLSKSKIEEAKQKTAERIMQMGRGKVPGGWLRWAEDITTPKVNWQKELSSLVRNAISYSSGAVDYSYARPSRRQSVFSNIVMPGMRKPNPAIAVVIDTSGSMDDRAISQVLAEVESILKSTGQNDGITVIACDAEVHFQGKVFKKSQVKALGGGGTNMCLGIEAAVKAKPSPQTVIVITDGDSPWPRKPLKNARLIVALTENTYQKCIPNWAKVVLVEKQL